MIYSSETRIISLMYFCNTEKVLSPMLVLTPYARERGGYGGWIDPFSNESLASLAR